MSEREKKRQIAKISVFITSIFVILLSVTYAFINVTLVGEKRQIITAGNLQLELLEDENNLTITNALPMYDEVGMIQDAFTFRLTNKTTLDTHYILKLVDITTGEKLDTSIVKYGLTKDGKAAIEYVSNLINGNIDSGVISGETTIEYSLRLWIDSKVEENNLILGKSLSYRIEVEASQEMEKQNYAMMRKRDSFESTELFWNYKDSITSIVFENAIDIPDTVEEDKKWDVSADNNESVMAYIEDDGLGAGTYKLHIQGIDAVAGNTDSSSLFAGFSKLASIEGFEYFDTSNVVNMNQMFYGCNALISLNLSNFDVSNVINMTAVFDSVKNDCLITVKDSAMVDWVKARNAALTNIVVKSA